MEIFYTEQVQSAHPMMYVRALSVLGHVRMDHHRAVQREQMRKRDPAGNIQFAAYHDILCFYKCRDGIVVQYVYDTYNSCHLFHTVNKQVKTVFMVIGS